MYGIEPPPPFVHRRLVVPIPLDTRTQNIRKYVSSGLGFFLLCLPCAYSFSAYSHAFQNHRPFRIVTVMGNITEMKKKIIRCVHVEKTQTLFTHHQPCHLILATSSVPEFAYESCSKHKITAKNLLSKGSDVSILRRHQRANKQFLLARLFSIRKRISIVFNFYLNNSQTEMIYR